VLFFLMTGSPARVAELEANGQFHLSKPFKRGGTKPHQQGVRRILSSPCAIEGGLVLQASPTGDAQSEYKPQWE
jgi:hypothetical protein